MFVLRVHLRLHKFVESLHFLLDDFIDLCLSRSLLLLFHPLFSQLWRYSVNIVSFHHSKRYGRTIILRTQWHIPYSSSCSGVRPVSLSMRYSYSSGIAVRGIAFASSSLSVKGNLVLNILNYRISIFYAGVFAKKYIS